jgi:hypothetical protein
MTMCQGHLASPRYLRSKSIVPDMYTALHTAIVAETQQPLVRAMGEHNDAGSHGAYLHNYTRGRSRRGVVRRA